MQRKIDKQSPFLKLQTSRLRPHLALLQGKQQGFGGQADFRLQEGFTLVDAIVGIFLVLILFLGLFTAFQLGLKTVGLSQNKITAVAIANQQIEMARNLPYASVGTVGATLPFAAGTFEQNSTVVRNNIEYAVETKVKYVVDEADGVAGPDDPCPNDYKKMEVKVSWEGRFGGEIFLSVIVAPENLAQECAQTGGVLYISAFDAYGIMVPSPLIEILDPDTDGLIDSATPAEGKYYFPLSPGTYKVAVSKQNYSTERTYGTLEVTTPERPHLVVLDGQVTEASFSIDKVSTMAVSTATWRNWWNLDYDFRKQIVVINNGSEPVPAGYSVKFNLDHYSLVQNGKSLASGNDVRIAFWDGSVWQELNRVNETVWNTQGNLAEIWFQTQSVIGALDSDSNYYVYYGNSSALSPPDNKNNVYVFADDFEAGSLDLWTVSAGDVSATTEQAAKGSYSMKIADVGAGAMVFRPQSFPFNTLKLDFYQRQAQTNAGFKHAFWEDVMGPPELPVSMVYFDDQGQMAYEDGSVNVFYSPALANTWYHIEEFLYFQSTRLAINVDGTNYVDDLDGFWTDPVDSIDFFRFHAIQSGTFYVDDVKIRLFSSPEPSVILGTEESLLQPISLVPFTLTGAKIIGTDAGGDPVYKYSADLSTDGSGNVSIPDLEWDLYTFFIDPATGLDLIDINPSPQPVNLPPDASLDVDLYLDAENSLLVSVLNAETLEPIFSATVRLYNTGLGYDTTQYTNQKGQTYFIPLEAAVYNLDVQAPAYTGSSGTVSISGDHTRTVTLAQIE